MKRSKKNKIYFGDNRIIIKLFFLAFCPEDTLSHYIDGSNVNVLFPITKAGYTNSSEEVCDIDTSGGKG